MIDRQDFNSRIYALDPEDQSKVVDFLDALEKKHAEEQSRRKEEAFDRLDEIREEIQEYFPKGFDVEKDYLKALDEKHGRTD